MAKNGQKWLEITQNDEKSPKITKMDQNAKMKMFSRMIENDLK